MSSTADSQARPFAPAQLAARLAHEFPAPQHYWVAYSGGVDSTVLLHLLAHARERLPAPLHAVHVDHGLHPRSGDWAMHCERVCRQLDVPLSQLRVDATARDGQSPEAAARDARYQAVAGLLGADDMLLTAHHRDDQAETLLLQLMRGAGVDGLAAMPAIRRWRNAWHARPLLDVDRATLRTWADDAGLRWIDDPSNAELSADRNYLRHRVLPLLADRWPAAPRRLAHSAALCAEAAEGVAALAAADLTAARTESAWQLDLAALCALGDVRARAALRHWLRELGAPPLPSRRLHEAISQLCDARSDAAVRIAWSDVTLRRYRGRLYLVPAAQPDVPDGLRDWDGETMSLGPGLGRLRRVRAAGGIDPSAWAGGKVQLGYRHAALRCRPAGRDGGRDFKKLAQDYAVPPWQRDILPVLYIDGQVAAIANCCACAPFAVSADESGWQLAWQAEEYPTRDSDSQVPE